MSYTVIVHGLSNELHSHCTWFI